MFKKPQFEEEMKNFVPDDYFEVILRVLPDGDLTPITALALLVSHEKKQ